MENRFSASYQGFFAIIIWAVMALMNVLVVRIPLFEMVSITSLIGFIIALISAYYHRRLKSVSRVAWANKHLVVVMFLFQLLYIAAFRFAPAVQVDLINYSWPLIVVIAQPLASKKRVQKRYVFASALGLMSVLFLILDDDIFLHKQYLLGYSMVLVSAFIWVYFNIERSKMKEAPAELTGFFFGITGVMALICHLLGESFVAPTVLETQCLVSIGVFGTGLSFIFWSNGIQKGCIRQLSIMCYLIPVLSVMLLIGFGQGEYTWRVFVSLAGVTIAPLLPYLFRSDRPQESL